MTGNSMALRLIAGCSLALMTGAAFAHDHHDGHSALVEQHASAGHGWNERGDDHYHHHHHHKPPLHGPGSSHNPVVYHPPVRPIPKPVVSAGPVKQAATTIVRDHRTPPPRYGGGGRPDAHCKQGDFSACGARDHRTPPPTQCFGDLC
jgi:hypothetical protein